MPTLSRPQAQTVLVSLWFDYTISDVIAVDNRPTTQPVTIREEGGFKAVTLQYSLCRHLLGAIATLVSVQLLPA